MLKIAKGYFDFCIPYNEKQDVMLEILNELIEGEILLLFGNFFELFVDFIFS